MMSKQIPILLNAIKCYNMDSGNVEFTDSQLESCAIRVYNQLLLRIEQLGYFEIKNKEVAALSVRFLIPEIVQLDLTHRELNELTNSLIKDLNTWN